MDLNIIVVDNFLDNPDKVRESVLKIDFPTTGSFPGKRSFKADNDYQKMIKEKIENIMNREIFFPKKYDSFCFQLCLEEDKSWAHTDDSEWAGVLYLTPNAPVTAGTGIFDKIEDQSHLNTMLGNVYNRLVMYRGNKLHHRSMLSGFGSNINDGRLTQVFFFNTYNDKSDHFNF
jgi:hypothetical protein